MRETGGPGGERLADVGIDSAVVVHEDRRQLANLLQAWHADLMHDEPALGWRA